MKVNKIQDGEHTFIAGMTRSGKSFLAETYLAGFNRVVKLDTKGEFFERRRDKKPVWKGLKEGKDYTVIFNLADLDTVTTPKIVYVPSFEEQTQEFYNALFKWVYERENTTVWIDELMSIADSPKIYPTYLKAIYTRGASKNVGAWALTQRPMDIPTICTANSTHFFVFDLMLNQDRKKMVDVTGMGEMLDKPSGHNFWYYRNGNQECVKAQLKV